MYHVLVRQFSHALGNLDVLLSKAEGYAKERGFDVNNLINARLAPDMLPFAAQVRIACDIAKATAAALSGKEAPRHEDTEKTFEELHARIGKCLGFVNGLTESDFANVNPNAIATLPRDYGKMRLSDYVVTRQIPNFYFHVTMAYALLREAGVPVGKSDYLGALSLVGG